MEKTGHDTDVTVTFKDGLSLELKTSLRKALEVARYLADEKDTGGPVEDLAPLTPVRTTPLISANSPLEIIRSSNAKTFPQQITAIALYQTQRNKTETFDPKEIHQLLRRMGSSPQNFRRDLRVACDVLNYISKEGEDSYLVTEHGREMVAKGFEGATEGSARRRKPGNRKKTSTNVTET